MQEDYIHYLLEWNRFVPLELINNNILDKDILFYFGNFSPTDAKLVIENFTKQAHFYLDPALIEELVNDLAGEIGEVRPIELQVVGTQLQEENITTLAQYRQSGPKAKLVKRFLEEVIKDCGPENEHAARLLLYFLTDENGTRPVKNKLELVKSLSELDEADKLDLVLEILVKSGLVFQLQKGSTERYQLVHDYLVAFIRHDYLVAFIRQQQNLLVNFEKQRKELLKRQAEIAQLRKQRWFLAIAVAGGVTLAILASWVEVQRRRVVTSAIVAHTVFSEALLASDQSVEALIESLKAAKKLHQSFGIQADTRIRVLIALQQALYRMQRPKHFEKHNDNITSVSFSPNSKLIASASADKTLKLWHLDGTLLKTLEGDSSLLTSVSFSPDGQLIASGSADNSIKLWQLDGTLLKTLKGHTDAVTSVSFSPDGQLITSGSTDNSIRLWRLEGTLIKILKGHTDVVTSVSFSPDGKLIASGSVDHSIRLWQLDGTLLKIIKGHTDAVTSVSFSPDSKLIASGSADHTIRFWQLDGTPRAILKGHNDGVTSLSFSPDGHILASAGTDSVKLWSRDGTLLETLDNFGYKQVSFSPDGKVLVSARDKRIVIWSLDLDELLVRGCNQARDYLTTHPNLSERERHLCDDIGPQHW
ncbi:MAG TPA: hypothetical protein DDZ80_16325 [Cyanobacteria bacterium UBA8803]|nr:hypothetical protein [Cyanobacteria bacterium UBA8803]